MLHVFWRADVHATVYLTTDHLMHAFVLSEIASVKGRSVARLPFSSGIRCSSVCELLLGTFQHVLAALHQSALGSVTSAS